MSSGYRPNNRKYIKKGDGDNSNNNQDNTNKNYYKPRNNYYNNDRNYYYNKNDRNDYREDYANNRYFSNMKNDNKYESGKSEKNENNNNNNKYYDKRSDKKKRQFFDDYLDEETVKKRLEDGTLKKGELSVSYRNRSLSYVKVEGFEYDVLVEGRNRQNRALHGDTVAVEVDPEDKWVPLKSKKDDEVIDDIKSLIDDKDKKDKEYILDEDDLDDDKADISGDDEKIGSSNEISRSNEIGNEEKKDEKGSEEKKDEKGNEEKKDEKDDKGKEEKKDEILRPTGKIVRILESKSPKLIGILGPVLHSGKPSFNYFGFYPEDKRMPIFYVSLKLLPDYYKNESKYTKKFFYLKYTNWDVNSQYPAGENLEEAGESGTISNELNALYRKYELTDGHFKPEVNEVFPEGVTVDDEQLQKRKDFRNIRIFSIDPKTARDIDDALSCVKLENGNYEVGVHIADVSFYVKPGTEVDKLAKEKATSTYLVNEVAPMLPRILCENLCSLNQSVDRYSFSITWEITDEGEIKNQWIGRGIIKSCAKLSYEDAQLVMDNYDKGVQHLETLNLGAPAQEIGRDILNLARISSIIRTKRFMTGVIRVGKVQLSFKLDSDKNPISFQPYELKESNALVEEFMLLANQSVANFLKEKLPDKAFLRNHLNPESDSLEYLKKFLSEKLKVELDTTSVRTINDCIETIPNRYPNVLYLKELVEDSLRIILKSAKYLTSSCVENQDELRHYALNLGYYTHFTSPIRRYADIIVHRELEAILENKVETLPPIEELKEIASNCNKKKSLARLIEDDSKLVFLSIYLKNNPTVRSDCVILSLGENYFKVYCVGLGLHFNMSYDGVNATYNEEEETVLFEWIDNMTEYKRLYKVLSTITCKLQIKMKSWRPMRPLDIEGRFCPFHFMTPNGSSRGYLI